MFAFVLLEELIVPSNMKLRYRARLINMNEFLPQTGISVAEAGPEDGLTGRPENNIANQKICSPIPPGWQSNLCPGVRMVQARLLLSVTPIKQEKKRLLLGLQQTARDARRVDAQ